ncbi:MAG TPA: uracil-DNA glycosylase family protein [Candidatus Hydrogenedentes bacterium]|nr:uracil-DNA glycosylase family protein [Candidatus Hydrogenedentota bacterium]HOV75170.1 uracil-DNA glycosylase family protein [Candidatus Hydrogenedentota bacterium]HPC17429.1 uracil-DNA glycosylase family protein [Candidatus Hydrogenedentota bacterium]HRT20856.1 uracil-DNA glycosylase family protein [Candidatus Hydrogenedentota bacterium]HRT66063.1 uracil-DNA glycosylase family protein [Candidatus Hydrogenedentota bacterium]
MAAADLRLEAVKQEARACRLCAGILPREPRPIFRACVSSRLLIVGQAPGLRVHETGIPWNDPSGDRLRAWMDVDRDVFYDESRIAIIPVGLCYPGRNPRGGDLPPRPECAPLWHPRLIEHLPRIQLTLLVGGYAHAYYLGLRRSRSVTETVRAWRNYLPRFFPLPHPSFRNNQWLKANPWFEAETIPSLRQSLHSLLARP